jgi:hypothetical protein
MPMRVKGRNSSQLGGNHHSINRPINPVSPVRKVVTGRRTGSMSGTFPSAKNGRLIPFESLLEADLIVLMEHDSDIIAYYAQPETFCWHVAGGRARRYTPDFLVIYSDSRRAYREVKLARRITRDPTLGDRRRHIELECSLRGASFEIWTEIEIRRGTVRRV